MPPRAKSSPTATRKPGRHAPALGVAEYALLGMIAEIADVDAGVHGYPLAQQFTEGPISRIIRLESGMLYHYLKKLARGGLIETRIETQERRPDRQIHIVTAAGGEALANWIAAPVRTTREIRLEFLVKLYLNRADTDAVRSLIDRQYAVMADLVASLRQQREGIQGTSDDETFERAVLDLRMSQTAAALNWLESLTPGGPSTEIE